MTSLIKHDWAGSSDIDILYSGRHMYYAGIVNIFKLSHTLFALCCDSKLDMIIALAIQFI